MLAFYLKKLIGSLLMPLPLTLLLLIASFSLAKAKPRLSRLSAFLAIVLLSVTSFHPSSNRLLQPFEESFAKFNLSQPVDAVVVLGGCHSSNANLPPAAQLCSSSLFRLVEGLRILQANPSASLVLSGYAATDERPHAEVMQEVALSLGVAAARIITYPMPKDTQEEAQVMQAYLQGKSFALVTEASHLPRAVKFFQQQGLNPLPAPAFKLSAGNANLRISASAAVKSERAFYEFWGNWWQRLKGVF